MAPAAGLLDDRVGEIEIDILNRQVRAGGSTLHLTAIDQSLLYVLAANAGRVLTREDILDAVWGPDFVPEQHRRPPRPCAARKAAERLAPSAVHRDRAGPGYRFVATTQTGG